MFAIKGGPGSDPNKMSEETRSLFFRVMHDNEDTLPVLHIIWNFTRCDDILRWLWKNQLTGFRLLSWLRLEFRNSPMGLVKYVLGRLDHEKKGLIIYGKDWKP